MALGNLAGGIRRGTLVVAIQGHTLEMGAHEPIDGGRNKAKSRGTGCLHLGRMGDEVQVLQSWIQCHRMRKCAGTAMNQPFCDIGSTGQPVWLTHAPVERLA